MPEEKAELRKLLRDFSIGGAARRHAHLHSAGISALQILDLLDENDRLESQIKSDAQDYIDSLGVRDGQVANLKSLNARLVEMLKCIVEYNKDHQPVNGQYLIRNDMFVNLNNLLKECEK